MLKLREMVLVMSEEDMDSLVTCPICSELLDDPVTCQYRHPFCRACILTWLSKERTCPLGRESEGVLTVDKLLPPCEEVVVTLNSVLVCCSYAPSGCPWTGPFEEAASHIDPCQFQPSSCSFRGCAWSGSLYAAQGHAKACEWRPWACPDCGLEGLRQGEEERHVTRDCALSPKTLASCAVCEVVVPRGKLAEHCIEFVVHHFEVMANRQRIADERLAQLEADLAEMRDREERNQLLIKRQEHAARKQSVASAAPVTLRPGAPKPKTLAAPSPAPEGAERKKRPSRDDDLFDALFEEPTEPRAARARRVPPSGAQAEVKEEEREQAEQADEEATGRKRRRTMNVMLPASPTRRPPAPTPAAASAPAKTSSGGRRVPPGAYRHFQHAERLRMCNEQPRIKAAEREKLMAAKWKTMDAAARAPYKAMALREREEYAAHYASLAVTPPKPSWDKEQEEDSK